MNFTTIQIQTERNRRNLIIQHWKPSEIEQVIIPKLPMPIQETISSKIQESFALKAESKRLLEEAKLMVERKIEKGGELNETLVIRLKEQMDKGEITKGE